MKHLCWLRVLIDYGPAAHPRAQGAVERVGGWLQEVLLELQVLASVVGSTRNAGLQYRSRRSCNDGIGRASPGEQAKVGDNVLEKEAASTLSREGVHSKLAHEHWTGPWQIVRVDPGLSYAVHLNGRSIRKRMVSAADIKPFHEYPVELRHAFEDEFAYLAFAYLA